MRLRSFLRWLLPDLLVLTQEGSGFFKPPIPPRDGTRESAYRKERSLNDGKKKLINDF